MLDDDPLQLQVMALMLAAGGLIPQCFTTPEQALAAAASATAPVTFLMDMRMPGVDPALLLAQIRQQYAGAHIVGMSATMPSQSLSSQFDGFLLKPLDPSQMQSALCACCKPVAAAQTPLNDAIFRNFASRMPADALDSLFTAYFADAAMRLDAIDAAIAREDAAACRHAAHALKGSSAMLGIQSVAASVSPLEGIDATSASVTMPPHAASLLLFARSQVEEARLALAHRLQALSNSAFIPPAVPLDAPIQESKTP